MQRWWVGVSIGLGFIAACVGSDPADSGGSASSSSSGSGSSSTSSSGATSSSSSSSGLVDASACAGVLCEGFEGEPTFANWVKSANDGDIVPVDGFASRKGLGAKLATADQTAPVNFLSAKMTRTTPLPAGRYVRLDLQFWVSTCTHSLLEIVRYAVGTSPVDLQWFPDAVKVRFYFDDNAASIEEVIYPVTPATTWTPFWVEVDRETGSISAAVGTEERKGIKTVKLPANAEKAFAPELALGVAATKPGCETRIDELKVSVRN